MPARAQPLPAFGPLSTVRYTVDGVDFDMVRVPPGRFTDVEGSSKRELLVSRPFEIGLTLVTQALWWAAKVGRPMSSSAYGRDRPVDRVSRDDVKLFLSSLESRGLPRFRLPTEAEWAWSVRCGVPTRQAGSNRSLPQVFAAVRRSSDFPSPPVSGVGVFDLSGGAWEWVEDWASSPRQGGVDLRGPESGFFGVVRGGDLNRSRVISRRDFVPHAGDVSFGFRLFRSVD